MIPNLISGSITFVWEGTDLNSFDAHALIVLQIRNANLVTEVQQGKVKQFRGCLIDERYPNTRRGESKHLRPTLLLLLLSKLRYTENARRTTVIDCDVNRLRLKNKYNEIVGKCRRKIHFSALINASA